MHFIPNPKSFLVVPLILLGLTGSVSLLAAAPKTHVDSEKGVSFQYPSIFVAGKFLVEELPPEAVAAGLEPPFKNAVVLVEPSKLRGINPKAIPVGEIPVIWVEVKTGKEARFYGRFLRKEFRIQVQNMTVFRLPGFPGPYGDAAFYYLVPLPSGRLLEVGAHREYFRDYDPLHPEGSRPTHYDHVIEALIPTIKYRP